mgnify:CR=1 FL=1
MPLKRTIISAAVPVILATSAIADEITTSEQPAGKSLTVETVTIANDGWLVIHAIADGKPVVPASIGHTAVKAGTTENVVVELTETVESGSKVLAMLHVDKGRIGDYEFPGDDHPVMQDDKPVVMPLQIK